MDERSLGWDDLRIVLAVARAGSLAGAAQALGASHPTLFRHVRRIEQVLGVRLFERSRTGYVATSAGEEMAALAARMQAEVDALEQRLRGRDLRPTGTVRLTTTDTLLFGPLMPVLAAFRHEHPGIVLELVAANAHFSLTRREADIALRPSSDPPDSLTGRRIADIAVAVYAAPALARLAAGADWTRHDWVAPDDSLSALPISRWMEERRLAERAVFRANSLLGLRDAARHGLGLALLPCYLGDADPGLGRVGAPLPELRGALWLLTHPELKRVARIRAVLDALPRLLAPLRPLFEGERPAAQAEGQERPVVPRGGNRLDAARWT